MSVSSNTAIIPYTKPMTPMEFIKSEVEKGLSDRSVKQPIPRQISSPSIDFGLIYLNLSALSQAFERPSIQLKSPLSSRRVENKPSGRILIDRFEFDDIRSPSRLSHLSPSKKLNDEEIAETLQAEASFTIATDKKPVVATYGCGPCVALGGYDSTNKIAFIVHFSDAEEVKKSSGLIFYNIAKLVKEKITTPIQLHLRGGFEGSSEPIIEAIKIWMKQREDLPMEIASEDILCSYKGSAKSLSIDSRTGKVSEYNPMKNPKSREISDSYVMSTLLNVFEPKIRLAYSPK